MLISVYWCLLLLLVYSILVQLVFSDKYKCVVVEKNVTKILYMCTTMKILCTGQTGSRPSTNPKIGHTVQSIQLKFGTKYQQLVICSCWEKRDKNFKRALYIEKNKYVGQTDVDNEQICIIVYRLHNCPNTAYNTYVFFAINYTISLWHILKKKEKKKK